MYDQVKKPYEIYPGYNTDAMDYQMLLAYVLVLLCTVIAAPVFTSDYQTGADDILRCTKYGTVKLAITEDHVGIFHQRSYICALCVSFYSGIQLFVRLGVYQNLHTDVVFYSQFTGHEYRADAVFYRRYRTAVSIGND